MVDLPGRVDIEGAFAKALGKEFAVTYKEVLALLGDPPDLDKLTPEWWDSVRERVAGAIRPSLEYAFGEALDAMAESVGYTFDWDLKNQAAIDWAIAYTAGLGDSLVATRRKKISEAVARFFDKGGNMAQLKKDIGRWVNPDSAALIAQTEVTRAAVGGERWGVRDLERQGVRFRAIFQTNNDSLTCPICGELNGVEITDGRFPPLHTGCRCWVNHEPIIEGKAYELAAFKASFKLVQGDGVVEIKKVA